MKRVFTLTAALLMLGFSYGQEKLPTAFSLQECIEFAKENNPNLKSAQIAIKASESKVGETLSTGLPQVGASADLANNFIIPTSFLPAEIVGGPAGEYVGVKFGTTYVGRATLNVDQMIFNGSYFVGLKASRTYTDLARKDLINSQTELVTAIKKAYYGVLVSTERLALVEKNVSRLDSLLKQTRVMYNNGFAEKIDVNRVEVQYNNIMTAKRTATIGLEIGTNILKFQMGYPMTEKILLTDNLETIKVQVLNEELTKDFNYNNRIEFSKLETNYALTQLDIKNTKVQYLPKLDFYGSYGASYGTSSFDTFISFGSKWRDLGVFGIRANVPIFDGLRKSNQIQQKKIQLQQIDNAKTFMKSQIDMEQQQAGLQFNNNLSTLRSQKANMELAEEVYNVTVIKYQQGVGSNIEVINADASFKEAQTNYYAALYDALIASVDLEKAYGKVLNQ
ncbi:MAG TPA: TolC family protein [Cyclobacteriaceae bacterium]|nr:TolC family protein [Cyclobacteriaceae bacterium]